MDYFAAGELPDAMADIPRSVTSTFFHPTRNKTRASAI